MVVGVRDTEEKHLETPQECRTGEAQNEGHGGRRPREVLVAWNCEDCGRLNSEFVIKCQTCSRKKEV